MHISPEEAAHIVGCAEHSQRPSCLISGSTAQISSSSGFYSAGTRYRIAEGKGLGLQEFTPRRIGGEGQGLTGTPGASPPSRSCLKLYSASCMTRMRCTASAGSRCSIISSKSFCTLDERYVPCA